ncbi:hypothetical protein [Thermoplasma acidophilum]|uniref:Uncharacterized protein n=1 Tax=Thermoplasma acidophilum (strain ATCC 25905 / DSM 1728 / JCM 9062 / NBRC 15155 / AMRC-C165) TaxID=273075 RepID=Q9HIH9_THEAC|nr:hypothetical protein [Thermoplasma acidophilum]
MSITATTRPMIRSAAPAILLFPLPKYAVSIPSTISDRARSARITSKKTSQFQGDQGITIPPHSFIPVSVFVSITPSIVLIFSMTTSPISVKSFISSLTIISYSPNSGWASTTPLILSTLLYTSCSFPGTVLIRTKAIDNFHH